MQLNTAIKRFTPRSCCSRRI